jgi:anti-anti-sigma factor
MKIRVWGARGSLPSPLGSKEIEEKICQAIYGMPDVDTDDMDAIRAYIAQLPPLTRGTAGGNTSCVEIQAGHETLILDSGSGINPLGWELMKGPCGHGQGTLHILFSHAHWDHIQGFPFFMPAYIPGNRIIIYSIHDLETILADQQRPLNFPVPLSFMQADIEFVRLEAGTPFSIGGVNINTIRHNHPGGSLGYRFEDQHSVVVYATDSEYKDLSEAKIQTHIDFFKDADALIFDAQYGLRESWESKVDWGHGSAMIGVDFARRAGVKQLILFHHEPTYSDLQLQQILSIATDYQAQDPNLPTCEIMLAYEGLTLDLTPLGAIDWQVTPDGETAILTASSTFDERGVDHLTGQLARLAKQEAATGSVIDLTQVEHLTTASLKALVTLSQQRKEGPIVLAAPSPEVEQVIKLGGYGDYFAIYPSVADAVKAIHARETLNLPGQTINGHYQIADKLGQGRLGVVLKVRDKQNERDAVLRILSPTFGVETIDHFAAQVHHLLDLGHRNIARVYDCDWSQDWGHTFVVEELMTGPTLHTHLKASDEPISTDEALDIALDLTLALEHAHSRGVVHGNLKPQDVFLTDRGVKVSGFGLGRLEEGRNLLEAPMIFLTASHLAPEQILGQPLDARTDLYALGVILYQLFTGRLPFEGTEREVMHAHLEQAPPPPSQLNPHLSRPVEHLILKLLAKNPNDRYASAQQTRRISSSLVFSTGDSIQPGKRGLVGREDQLQTLQACWDQALTGRGQLAFITGELGIGKTSLAQHAAAQSEAPVLLVGHCQEQDGSPAYHPFAEALVAYFATVPPEFFDEEARRLMGDFTRLVPGLRQAVPSLSEPPPLEPKQEQLRLISSLTRFIKQATRARPWFLILEDLQWADRSSIELLRYLGRHLPEMALFTLGTFRDLELETDHPLRAALRDLSGNPGYRHLPLDRLSLTEVAQLLGSIWDSTVPDSLIERIYQHTEGNPLYVEEVAKGLVDDGLVSMQAGRWQFPEVDTIRLPQGVHDAVEGRIHHLRPDTRDVLSLAAVLGQRFRFDDLLAMSGQSEWELLEHLDLALERQLIQEISGGNVLRFNHVEIHRVIYSDLGVLRRRRLHRQAGEILEQQATTESGRLVEELAHHFSQAGEFKKALDYTLEAARQAQAAYANEAASQWYKRALRIMDQLPPEQTSRFDPIRLSLYKELGDVLTLIGQWGEARNTFQEALELAEALGDTSAQAWSQTSIGGLLWKQGALDEASEWLARAHIAFATMRNRVGVGEVLHQKGTVAAQQGNYEEARALYQRSLAIRRRLGDKVNVADLLNNLGFVAKGQGNLKIARTFLEESLEIRRELGDKWGIAMSLTDLGSLITLNQEDYSNAQSCLEEAIVIQREVGDQLNLAIALNKLGNVFRDLGEYVAAHPLYEESLTICSELEAVQAVADVLGDIAGLAALQGQPERACCLSGAAEAQREAIGGVLPPVEQEKLDRLLAPARQTLDEAEVTSAISVGRAMLLEEAIEYALQYV